MKKINLNLKPLKMWEYREYSKGTLLENGLVLNNTAAFIYKLCDGKKTIKEITGLIMNNYKVNKKRAETDTLNCIRELLTEKAIKLR